MNKVKKWILRPSYQQKLWLWKDNDLIKVIMGPRRSGKSVLMTLFQNDLLAAGVTSDHLISVNLEDIANIELQDPQMLHRYVLDRLIDDKIHYVFIDEIQQCLGFEKVLASLALRPNIDLYVTGSNAYMLSSELATYLTGRYISLEMMPLSFSEFRQAVISDGRSKEEDFARYLTVGSFPALVDYRDDEAFTETYYEMLTSSMIVKDIARRYQIRDVTLLERLIRVLSSSLGSSISTSKILNTLKTLKNEVSALTLSMYLNALAECYFFIKVPRFDVRGRMALRSLEKFYLCDPGFRQYYVKSSVKDLGHLLENVVYLELRRRFSKVCVGKVDRDKEIDFVVSDRDGLQYYQVALSVLDEQTLEREIGAFNKINDHYPKYLLTLDTIGKDRSINGIRQLNVLDWLLGEVD